MLRHNCDTIAPHIWHIKCRSLGDFSLIFSIPPLPPPPTRRAIRTIRLCTTVHPSLRFSIQMIKRELNLFTLDEDETSPRASRILFLPLFFQSNVGVSCLRDSFIKVHGRIIKPCRETNMTFLYLSAIKIQTLSSSCRSYCAVIPRRARQTGENRHRLFNKYLKDYRRVIFIATVISVNDLP